MIKRVNFRLPVAFAISIICGTAVCYYSPTLKFYGIIIIFAAALIAFGLSELSSEKRGKRAAIACACLFFALLGYGRLKLCEARFNETAIKRGNYTVSGTVKEVSQTELGKKIVLKDCSYGGERGGNIVLYGIDASENDKITVSCYAYPLSAVQNGKYSYNFLENINAAGGNAELVSVDGNAGGIFYTVKQKIKSAVSDGSRASGIALAVTTGDTSMLTAEEKENFRMGGIAHIFAVSGMHVGLLFAALSFIFKPFKINIFLKNFTIFLILAFYSGVCGFSASSLRAVITCGGFLLARCAGEKPDALNSLALAALIIAIANTREVLGAGFILSFSVCLSIIILAPPIKRKTAFLGRKFSAALAVTVAAELAAMPVCVAFFGKFPLLAIITNIALIPAVTAFYYLLWIGIIINIVLPFQSVGLFLPFAAFDGLYVVTSYLSSGATIETFPLYSLAIYYPSLLGASDVINAGKRFKTACAVAAGAAIIAALV